MSDPMPHDLAAYPPIEAKAASTLTQAQRIRGLVALFASILAAGITFGTTIPMIALILEKQGHSSTVIGLNSAMPILATLLMAWLLPHLLRRVKTITAMLGGIAVIVVCFLLMPVFPQIEAWFLLRFLVGLGMSVHWVVSETWLNAVSEEKRRGLMAGLYATQLGLGFCLGPLMLTFIPLEGFTPFVIVAGFILMAALPLLAARGCVPEIELSHGASRWTMLVAAPTVFAAAFCSGLMDAAVLSFLPIYALRSGLGQDAGVLLLSVTIAGTVALQVPLGLLSDRMNRRVLLLVCGFVGLIGALALPGLIGEGWSVWLLVFVWGGVFVGLYTVALAMMGHRFKGGQLPQANGLFVMLYCLGSMTGPPLAGSAMDLIGPQGFPQVLAAAAGGFLLLGLLRSFSSTKAN
ncbi:MAG: MFS transporter [Limibacillus sp.]